MLNERNAQLHISVYTVHPTKTTTENEEKNLNEAKDDRMNFV